MIHENEKRADPAHSDSVASVTTGDATPRSLKQSSTPSFPRLIGFGLIVLLVIGIAAAATRKDKLLPSKPTHAETRVALPMAVNTLVVGEIAPEIQTRSYSGSLIARFESRLSFERSGRVDRIGPHEGARVESGTVLASLAQDDLDAKQHRIESELAAAQAVLDELVAGPREQTIQAAAAKVNELAARVLLAETNAKRQSKLAPQGATSQSQLDSASFGFQASRHSLIAAEALLRELKEGTRDEQIDAQRAKCEAIRGSLREIEADRADSRIVAPFAGSIQNRMVDEGAVVSPGSAALHLVSHAIEARVALPPAVAQSLRVGSDVSLRCNGQSRPGWVDRVSPTINDDTRTRDVFFRLVESQSDDQSNLFSSLSQQGWVVGEIMELIVFDDAGSRQSESEHADKHWLPISSLSRGTRGLWTVLVVPGSAAIETCERRFVELLKTEGSYAAVQGMLNKGERVIADGLHRVTAGMVVRSFPRNSTTSTSEKTPIDGEPIAGEPQSGDTGVTDR